MKDDKKHICKYCNKEFKSGQSLGAHITHCKENPNSCQDKWINKKQEKYENENPLQDYLLKCVVCGKEYKLQLRKKQYEQGKYRKTCCNECSHKLSSLNTNLEEKNKKISNYFKGKPSWIKGKKRINNSNINNRWTVNSNWTPYNICPICGKKYYNKKLRYCSSECLKIGKHIKLSEIAKKSNFGGYYPNSIKNHHHGNYKGIHCDSSWELAYLVYCLEHNIDIKRCTEVRYYTLNKKKCKYFPDFVVNNQIIEIKGYFDKVAKIKSEQNPDIKVLLYDDLKESLEYTINKYGNKFWEVLYDK